MCPWPAFTSTLERLRHMEELATDAWRKADGSDEREVWTAVYGELHGRADLFEQLKLEAARAEKE